VPPPQPIGLHCPFQVVDPTSKKTYWYHSETKETTWVKVTSAYSMALIV
jgi:hypothetical protein